MRAVMLAHVDELLCLLRSAESRLDDGARFTDEGHYGAVGGLSGIHVEYLDTLHRGD